MTDDIEFADAKPSDIPLINHTIGRNLASLRKGFGWRQPELVLALRNFGVSVTVARVSQIENGAGRLNAEQVEALCRIFDTTPNELFGYRSNLPAHDDARTVAVAFDALAYLAEINGPFPEAIQMNVDAARRVFKRWDDAQEAGA